MHTFIAELHVHTVLSPCAEIEMIPPLIVQEALDRGINLIAVTDHNASANVPAVQKAARQSGLAVLPGMEVQTREEVHVLTLFDDLDRLETWQGIVNSSLPPMQNDPDYFGHQLVVDHEGEYLRHETRLLSASLSLSIESVFDQVNRLGGLAVPAHVDRKAFGLIGVLGLIPPSLPIEALEVSRSVKVEEIPRVYPGLVGYPILQNGDAHRLDELLGVNKFYLEEPTISEIRLALPGRGGRKMWNTGT